MPRFDRYLLRQNLVLFGFFALVLVLVSWVNRAVVLFDQIIADGQSAGVFLELTILSLPSIIRIVLPLSAFLASVYVTNRLAADSELVVMQATGFSPWRLARPALAFGIVVTLMGLVLSNVLVPLSIERLNLRQEEIARSATARLLQEGQFLTPAPDVTLYLREITPAGELRDLFLHDDRDPAESLTYTASSAYLVQMPAGPQLVMVGGQIQRLGHADGRLLVASFADLVFDLAPFLPAPDPGTWRSSRELPTPALLFPTDETARLTSRSAEELRAEGHDRLAQPLLALAAVLLGFAPLLVGGYSRFGLWPQIAAAVGLVLLAKAIESAAVAGLQADPGLWPLVYLPALAGMAMAVAALALAARPRGPGRRKAARP
ncbi:MAG: LPS export ABC transporter permease LptF [Rubellimicrobium sp.]|nr:LPS export ABC transporter permease LptF [Rubellimicrobium sp.]